MKKLIIPLLTVLMVVSIIFAGCFGPSVPAQPGDWFCTQPGDWFCTKLDGLEEVTSGVVLVAFRVNPTSTGITAVGCVFQDFTCGGINFEGTNTVESAHPWPITRGRFTIERVTIVDTTLGPLELTVQGKFDGTGTHASGTLEFRLEGTILTTGTWEAWPD